MKLFKKLYFQVLLATLLGIGLGHFYPELAITMKPLADGFIKLIKMMIAPIIFVSVVSGIAKMSSMKEVGRIGIKALIYFEIMTTVALILGLVVMHFFQPGVGLQINLAQFNVQHVSQYLTEAKQLSATEFLLNIIPHTFVDAFAKGEILQVLLIALLFSYGLLRLGEKGKSLLQFIDQTSLVLFNIIHIIVKLAPIGAFGAMAFAIGAYGIGTLAALGKLLICVYVACLFFIFLILGSITKLNGISLWAFLKHIKDELLIVLSTSSSEAALPSLMEKLESFGCDKAVVSLVVPTGYSFNLDGTCIYLTMAALFIAQAMSIHLDLMQELSLLAVLLLTSKGAAGVTGSGFIVLAATLAATHTIPVTGLVLLLGVDRFMSEARSLTNFIGNGVATLLINKWEKPHLS